MRFPGVSHTRPDARLPAGAGSAGLRFTRDADRHNPLTRVSKQFNLRYRRA